MFISYKLRRKEIINYKVSFKNFIVSCIIFKPLNLITVNLKDLLLCLYRYKALTSPVKLFYFIKTFCDF